MRRPEVGPLGETFLDANTRAMVGASFVNRPGGGKVETVVTLETQRLFVLPDTLFLVCADLCPDLREAVRGAVRAVFLEAVGEVLSVVLPEGLRAPVRVPARGPELPPLLPFVFPAFMPIRCPRRGVTMLPPRFPIDGPGGGRYNFSVWPREGGASPPLSRNCERRGADHLSHWSDELWEGGSIPVAARRYHSNDA